MSTVNDVRAIAGGMMVGLLAAVTAMLWWQASGTQSEAATAAQTLAECRQLADQVRALEAGPQKAEFVQRPVEEISKLIEGWTKQAGIAAERLLRVEPRAPRRVGDTDYLEQGAKVELRDVTLLQLAQFADCVSRQQEQLAITDLRLTAPRQEAAGPAEETWQAELVLTSLVYAPQTAP